MLEIALYNIGNMVGRFFINMSCVINKFHKTVRFLSNKYKNDT